MMFDLNKPYRTRDGREAKVLGTMPDGRLCGCTKVSGAGPSWMAVDWDASGKLNDAGRDCGYDLINVPEKRTVKVWINVYPAGLASNNHQSRESADRDAASVRIACIEREFTFEVGEGLDK